MSSALNNLSWPVMAEADFASARRPARERHVRGDGRFVADLAAADVLHVAFARSVHAHARLLNLDLSAALESDGVVAVFDGAAVAHLPAPQVNAFAGLDAARRPAQPLLAVGQISRVGEALAMVVAHSRVQAVRAAEQVFADVKELACINDEAALEADAVFAVQHTHGTAPETPTHQVHISLHQPRVAPNAMEPRAALAQWHEDERMTLWVSSQTPSRARDEVCRLLNWDVERLRVIAPDVGGAFGGKASLGAEELLVAWAAVQLKRSVRWVATRSEELQSAPQGRGAHLSGALALDAEGGLTSFSADLHFPLGSWMTYSAVVPARNAARILPGPYRVASVRVNAKAAITHAAPVGIYRGAGRPEAALLMETLIEKAARASGIDPLELRRRNLITPDMMPWTTPTGEKLESGNYPALLTRAAELFDYADARERQSVRRRAGECVGIGAALYIEPCGQGWESAQVSIETDGTVTVASGSSSQGQDHQAAYAAIAARVLGVPVESVRVIEADTARCPPGIGALASRSIAIGGSAVEAAASQAAARRSAGEALPIAVFSRYEAPLEAWASGCVLAKASIDVATGALRVERIAWVDDAGVVIDPAGVKDQLVGGLAQGLGQALLERIVYDEHGQLLTGSLMDYALPRADQIPPITLADHGVPSTANALGARGVGEAGCIGVPAAIYNAALDALAPFKVDALAMPLSPQNIWRALQNAKTQ
jgi:aerobic carbon-monoxide dehydrogenase large subunit